MPRMFAVVAGLLAVAFVGLIAWAGAEKGLGAGFAAVLAERWGVVALADLYLGFVILAGWIAAVERRAAVACAWIIALFLLGNVTSLVYVSIRAWRADSWRAVFLPDGGCSQR